MGRPFSSAIRAVLRKFGYDIIHRRDDLARWNPDFTAEDLQILESVRPFTQTSPERLYALLQSVRYVQRHSIPGAIVECGVWKGGSMMAAARALLDLGDSSRELFLFDTFQGMTEPADVDVAYNGVCAKRLMEREPELNAVALAEVKANMQSSGYPEGKLHFIRGKVEDTLPREAPPQIALLRLDTDWYESTKHELVHLFPRIAPSGVLIIDDYGHFAGCRKAVDEYLETLTVPILLNRVDYTGRIAVVPPGVRTP